MYQKVWTSLGGNKRRKVIQMKNKKGNATGAIIVILLIAMVLMVGGFVGWYILGGGTTQSITNTEQISSAVSSGTVAQIKVYVRDVSATNINTKIAVPVYCTDQDGKFVIDGTSSSTTAEISGSTTRGNTVTCYAFNSSFQTVIPVIVNVDSEIMHVVIDGYKVSLLGKLAWYSDTFATGNEAVNVTGVGASSTGTMNKIRYTNNVTSQFFPLAGIYINRVVGSNVSDININSGIVSLKGSSFLPKQSSASIAKSSLTTNVGARKDSWDFVFEFNNGATIAGYSGNSPVLLEANDYVETGTVSVLGDGDGCGATASEIITPYAFTKGYYRGTLTDTVKYGHETDAASSSVISTDITGDHIYCTA
jgi:hypothetical protein